MNVFYELQINEVLFVSQVLEKKQKILIDASNAIGTWRETTKTRKIDIKDGFVVNKSFFFWGNLFRVV